MSKTAILDLDGKKYEFPVIVGSENETAIDISKLRDLSGAITMDPGYKNSGVCKSDITFLDGEEGILRYRGYSIEELAYYLYNNAYFVDEIFFSEDLANYIEKEISLGNKILSCNE